MPSAKPLHRTTRPPYDRRYALITSFRSMCGAAGWLSSQWAAYRAQQAMDTATALLDAWGGVIAGRREGYRHRIDAMAAELDEAMAHPESS